MEKKIWLQQRLRQNSRLLWELKLQRTRRDSKSESSGLNRAPITLPAWYLRGLKIEFFLISMLGLTLMVSIPFLSDHLLRLVGFTANLALATYGLFRWSITRHVLKSLKIKTLWLDQCSLSSKDQLTSELSEPVQGK